MSEPESYPYHAASAGAASNPGSGSSNSNGSNGSSAVASTRGAISGAERQRTYWGLRSPEVTLEVRARSRLHSHRMPPDGFYTHTTAAQLHGIPLPTGLARNPAIHVTVATPLRAHHDRGVIGHGLQMNENDIVDDGVFRFSSPERTWCDLGGLLNLSELVAAGDYLVHWQAPFCSPARLAQTIERLPNRRHVRILRRAQFFLSERSNSEAESIMRVILDSGRFPPAMVSTSVSDHFGEFVSHTTFIIEELRLALCYRDDRQVGSDGTVGIEAHEWAEEDYLTLVITARDLRDPAGLIRRLWQHVQTRARTRN